MKHGEKSVCMRVCYKSELIESEILSGLKWDPPASLTLRHRQRAANMTEFIKCVIKELKLSVAKHPCTLFQVDLPMIQPAQAAGLLLSLHLGISNAALNFLLCCLISGFCFSRHFDIIIFSSGFGSNGFDQPEREADASQRTEEIWKSSKHFCGAENGAGQLCFSLNNRNESLILPSILKNGLKLNYGCWACLILQRQVRETHRKTYLFLPMCDANEVCCLLQ